VSDFTAQLRQLSGYASLGDERQQSADETERIDGKRKPPKRIVCSFCPFCGAELK